jgi:hypothetical protein
MTVAKKAAAEVVLELPVSFGNLSVGDKTASIGVTVDRKKLRIGQADNHFCGNRLDGEILLLRDGEAPDQGHLDGFDKHERQLSGSFDVKGFRVSEKLIAFQLVWPLKDLDIEELCHFAKRSGELRVNTVGKIPDEDEESGEGDDEAE